MASTDEQRALTEAELVSLLEAASSTRFDEPIRITLTTGLRRGELLALRWEDIDLDGRRLNVRQTVSVAAGTVEFREPKSRSRRSIGLSAPTVALLRDHRVGHTERRLAAPIEWSQPDLVFPSTTGTVWQFRNFLRDFRKVLARTDIEETGSINWHTLRHTAASQWIASGASVFEVSRRLGHSSTSTTERVYAHLLPRQDDVSAHALDHLIAT